MTNRYKIWLNVAEVQQMGGQLVGTKMKKTMKMICTANSEGKMRRRGQTKLVWKEDIWGVVYPKRWSNPTRMKRRIWSEELCSNKYWGLITLERFNHVGEGWLKLLHGHIESIGHFYFFMSIMKAWFGSYLVKVFMSSLPTCNRGWEFKVGFFSLFVI